MTVLTRPKSRLDEATKVSTTVSTTEQYARSRASMDAFEMSVLASTGSLRWPMLDEPSVDNGPRAFAEGTIYRCGIGHHGTKLRLALVGR